ncbi:hypothetical protein BH11ARM2_BH11ARM2_01010 [soil metagenome]
MRRSLVALCFLSVALAQAQNLQETHGKTHAQMLGMGYEAWTKFYIGKEGESTVGMTNAAGLYADALNARNRRLMARLKLTEKVRFTRIHKDLNDFTVNATSLGACLTGGGTMWNPIGADMMVRSETALYQLLAGLTSKAPARVVSDVTKEIAALTANVARTKPEGNWVAVARDSATDLNKAFAGIVANAKTLPRKDSDLLLQFCLQTIKDVRETGSPQ